MQRIYDYHVWKQGLIAEETGSPASLNSLYSEEASEGSNLSELCTKKFEMYRFLDMEVFFHP